MVRKPATARRKNRKRGRREFQAGARFFLIERHRKRYSMDEVADATGVSKSTICRIENARICPTVRHLLALFDFYKVKPDPDFITSLYPMIHEALLGERALAS